MLFNKTKKKNCGRKPVPAARQKTRFIGIKTTNEFAGLVLEVQKVKDLSMRQIFEQAVVQYVRNDPELKHLAEKTSCNSPE